MASEVYTEDIQFKLHDKFEVFLQENDDIRSNVSLLAAASSQGLLFTGNPNEAELKVFMLKQLVDVKTSGQKLLVRTVPLPGIPNAIACSADSNMLSVNYTQNGSSFLVIYSVPTFLTASIRTLYNIRLSSEDNVSARQLLWNPVITSSLAVVLSNGALAMYTLKENGQFEMHILDKSQQVKSGCWSPKGKQIVLGFPNGKLQQFKPDLTPAKTITCPAGLYPQPFDIIAVHWLSTFQFAAIFLQHGEDIMPTLLIINAPKGGTPAFITYIDVCYSATGLRDHQFSFTHIPQWNILLVASANGIEVGILSTKESGDTPTWFPYSLAGEARIEMPLVKNTTETYPIGFALDNSSSHRLIMGENQLPVMPLVHVLSTYGHLIVYNFLNLIPGVADICSPPPPLSDSSGEFKPLEDLQTSQVVQASAPTANNDVSFAFNPTANTSTPATQKDKPTPLFSGIGGSTNQPNFTQPSTANFGFGGEKPATTVFALPTTGITPKAPLFGNTAVPGTGFGGTSTPSTGFGGSSAPFTGFGGFLTNNANTFSGKPMESTQKAVVATSTPTQQEIPTQQKQQSVIAPTKNSAELNKPLYTVQSNFTPPTQVATQLQQKKDTSDISSNEIDEIVKQMIAITTSSFSAEIKQMAKQSNGLLDNIGHPSEMKICTKRLNDLQEINDQAKDREFEMDVQNLRQTLNESYAMLAECRSNLEMYNNPDITRLASITQHDPMTQRQLAKLNNYVAINQSQLQFLQQQIDANWSDYQDMLRRRTKHHMHIPCLDGLYQRMSNLKDLLAKQRNRLDHIKVKLNQNGYHYKSMQETTTPAIAKAKTEHSIDNLADSILSLGVSQANITHRPKLPLEKLHALRQLAQQQRDIKIIKPQRPNRVGLKSEVILESKLKCDKQAALKLKQDKEIQAQQATKSKQEQEKVLAMSANTINKPSSASFNIVKTQPVPPKPTQVQTPQAANPQIFNFNGNRWQNPTATGERDLETAPKVPAANFTFTQPPNNATFTAYVNQNKPSFDGFKLADKPSIMPVNQTSQAPVSFSAKIITSEADTSSVAKPNATTAIKPVAEITKESAAKPTDEAPKSFNFNAPTVPTFSGFGSIATSKSGNTLFDGKITTSTAPSAFSFGGLGSTFGSAVAGFGSSGGNTTGATTFSFSQPQTTTVETKTPNATTLKTTSNAFAGVGKKIDASFSNNTIKPSTTDISIKPAATDASSNVTNMPTASTPAVPQAVDPAEALLGTLNICKPTVKEADSSKPSNIFSGFASTLGSNTSGAFNFGSVAQASVTSASLTFGNLTSPISSSNSTSSVAITTTSSTFSFAVATTATTITSEAKQAIATTSAITTTTTTTAVAATVPSTASAPAAAATATSIATTSIASGASTFSFASAFSSLPTTTGASTVTTTATSTATAIPATPIFGAVATTAPATSTIFGGTGFGSTAAGTTPASMFGGSAITATTAADTNKFGAVTSTTATTPATNIFGSVPPPNAAATTAPATPQFGSTSPPPPAGNLFGTVAKPTTPGTNLFTGTTNAAPFGGNANATSTNATMFGGTAATSWPTGGSIFNSGAANTPSTFGAATGGSIFGASTVASTQPATNIFGSPTAPTAATQNPTAGSIFGQSTFGQASTANSGGSIFGGGAAAASTQQTVASGSIFGGASANAASTGSIFGGSAQANTSAFGSPTAGTTGFGTFSQTANTGAFSSPNTSGSFAQGGASVAQTGFGSPQQQSAFAKPVFGGAPAFGSPTPAFGATPSFGGAPTFGSPKPFGAFASPTTAASPTAQSAFGSPSASMQKNNLFEALGSTTDSGLSFGNLAQTGAVNQQPKTVFGGSKFMNYRA